MTEILPRDNASAILISDRLRDIDRIVVFGVLLSLLTKFKWFILGFKVNQQYPLQDDFFPAILQSAWVYVILYFGCLLLALISMVVRSRTIAISIRSVLMVCLYILCIHQQTYNDVTFLTCLWTVAWSTWFIWEIGRRPERELIEMATTFSHLVLSLIFLGGAVGKMTPGYWNGEVIFGIYFESRDYWVFNWLREHIPAQNLPELAKWYSRMIVGMEWTCSFLWLMPPRFASALAFLTLFGIAFFSNFLLFSVVGCLLGLALMGLFSPSKNDLQN